MLLSLPFTKAQVTIGTLSAPHPSAVLDLQSNDSMGLLLPRVALTDTILPDPLTSPVKGMFVYNTNSSDDGKVVEGIYFNDGRRWWQTNVVSEITLPDQWFYMPSFNLPLSDGTTNTTGLTYDLYQEYVDQFTGASTVDPNVASVSAAGDGSAAALPVAAPYDRTRLIFYVTAYSHDVITVNNITDGVLNYDVKTNVVPDGSFINVIFKVKNN